MTSLRELLPSTIKTPRLVLSPPNHGDVGRLSTLVNNWNVARWTARIPFPYAEADMIEYLEDVVPASETSYAMRDTQGQANGIISLMFDGDAEPELGYWLAEPFWGQGLVSEALAGLLDAVRATKIATVVKARVLAENLASARVLEKAGFAVVERTQSINERHLGKLLLIMRWTP